MTAPRFAGCRCGHSKEAHSVPSMAPQCTAQKCACLQYRPDVARNVQPATPVGLRPPGGTAVPQIPQRSVPIQAESAAMPEPTDRDIFRAGNAPTIEQILAAAKRSEFKRTIALAEKIAEQVADLRGRLNDEREAGEEARKEAAVREQARKQIAELERQLAAARAALRGGPVSPGATRSISGESVPCTEVGCARVFSRPQGLSRHLRETHGVEKAGAA
jgi:hypothetical protein